MLCVSSSTRNSEGLGRGLCGQNRADCTRPEGIAWDTVKVFSISSASCSDTGPWGEHDHVSSKIHITVLVKGTSLTKYVSDTRLLAV